MATATETATRERRGSIKPRIRLPKLALRGARRKQSESQIEAPQSAAPCRLLELPSELLINVVSNLHFADVLALRRVNRSCNLSITERDSAIARYWARHGLSHIPKHLDRLPDDGRYWQYVLSHARRWKAASDLASDVRDYIQYKTLLYVDWATLAFPLSMCYC